MGMMLEKIGYIKNPLTIIAIFAGLAEVSGTGVLPFITDNNQEIFIWFLMIFPLVLICLFFLTLNFNHKVLYAPSDYQNEDNFVNIFHGKVASPEEKMNKILEDNVQYGNKNKAETPKKQDTKLQGNFKKTFDHKLFEEKALQEILQKFPGQYMREITFGESNKYTFDAVIDREREREIFLVEIKHIQNFSHMRNALSQTIRMIAATLSDPIPIYARHYNRTVVLGIITADQDQRKEITAFIDQEFKKNKLESSYKIMIFNQNNFS